MATFFPNPQLHRHLLSSPHHLHGDHTNIYQPQLHVRHSATYQRHHHTCPGGAPISNTLSSVLRLPSLIHARCQRSYPLLLLLLLPWKRRAVVVFNFFLWEHLKHLLKQRKWYNHLNSTIINSRPIRKRALRSLHTATPREESSQPTTALSLSLSASLSTSTSASTFNFTQSSQRYSYQKKNKTPLLRFPSNTSRRGTAQVSSAPP